MLRPSASDQAPLAQGASLLTQFTTLALDGARAPSAILGDF